MNILPQDINAYIQERIPELLPPGALGLLFEVAREAVIEGWEVYLEGGSVRDCLLNVSSYDIDVAVVGDAPALARKVASRVGARLLVHEGFGTATLEFDDWPFTMDIVTARRETYERPGALPTVEASNIANDMARRDFTINAMAVRILPAQIGALVDLYGGVNDMRAGLIRVLYDKSFEDDPTRIFRGVKLAVRLGFEIEKNTLELILRAVRDGLVSNISIDRTMREIMLILQEPNGSDVMAMLDRLGVLGSITPPMEWPFTKGKMEPIAGGKQERLETNLAALAIQAAAKDAELAEAFARYLHMPAPLIKLMRDSVALMSVWDSLAPDEQRPSETYRILHPFASSSLEAMARLNPTGQIGPEWEHLLLYLDKLRYVKTTLNGDYLRKLGIQPGPLYRAILEALLAAKLDGGVQTEAEEEQFVMDWLAGNRGA